MKKLVCRICFSGKWSFICSYWDFTEFPLSSSDFQAAGWTLPIIHQPFNYGTDVQSCAAMWAVAPAMKTECWALCHQYSCTCVTFIYILVLYLQNSSKASQAPSPWGGNGKWVFSAQYFCLGTNGCKGGGGMFWCLWRQRTGHDSVVWELQVCFKCVQGRKCSSGLQNWPYS